MIGLPLRKMGWGCCVPSTKFILSLAEGLRTCWRDNKANRRSASRKGAKGAKLGEIKVGAAKKNGWVEGPLRT